ncbi:maleylpyruvate isomerase family mycothiol-dependent enzyme [Streptomyces cupreus]|uniref:Maleylpyruvate isomerase family mycothiol-dependent enzyme n=1 Tax=Streptomyces cupreus TaxID=2759956 RepID=A0A7X1IWZ5_9ACTN|nr:maleylpyruvate isomerase family mycothiol-dependent enzyme [Streptomyces cupreus]MBC2900103.1 maleylpyruvate isomerase family mycothiol-dependent enzyme [Streptomyces cupreus]
MNGVSGTYWLGQPIDARPLFGSELGALLKTLRGLRAADWRRPALPGWTVHDLAAHILGDSRGRLGGNRGALLPGESLVAYIHRTNQELVDRHADDSPAALIDALESAGTQVAERFAAADLDVPALGVSWAGVDPAPAWLDIAREFTEYWTHRQQIRHAVGRPTDPEPHAMSTVLDTFMRALPHTLRHTTAPVGAQIEVIAEGEGGGRWSATSTAGRWTLAEPPSGRPTASVLLDTETAWRLCTRGIEPAIALGRARIQGEHRLAAAVCEVVSIVR